MTNDAKHRINSNSRLKIAVWETNHHISYTVSKALVKGFNAEECLIPPGNINAVDDVNIAYGILRGCDRVFRECDKQNKPWFNIDNGFFNPGHFDGYYRISYKGTQAKWHDDIPQQDIDFKLEDWKKNEGKYLICLPTRPVMDFFNIGLENDWIKSIQPLFPFKLWDGNFVEVRRKGDIESIEWDKIKGVITFNSSIGWQALQRGIPVYSDPDHSIIGSYYKAKLKNPIDFLSDEYKQVEREPLFKAMRAHQFTLKEISEGKAWPILQHYLSKSI